MLPHPAGNKCKINTTCHFTSHRSWANKTASHNPSSFVQKACRSQAKKQNQGKPRQNFDEVVDLHLHRESSRDVETSEVRRGVRICCPGNRKNTFPSFGDAKLGAAMYGILTPTLTPQTTPM